MGPALERDRLIFDGDCGICTWCARWVEARVDAKRMEVVPYYEIPEAELAPYDISWEDCTRAVQFVTEAGRVHRGALAVNACLWRVRGWRWLVALLYLLFPLIGLEILAYRLVAKNRHRISAALGMNACRVRFDEEGEDGSPPDGSQPGAVGL